MTDRRPYTLILTILLSAGSVRAQDGSEFPIGAWFPGLFIHDQTQWNARLQLVDAANFNTIHAALENQTTSGLTHAQLNQRNQVWMAEAHRLGLNVQLYSWPLPDGWRGTSFWSQTFEAEDNAHFTHNALHGSPVADVGVSARVADHSAGLMLDTPGSGIWIRGNDANYYSHHVFWLSTDNITGPDVELARIRAIITYRDHAGNNRVVTRESPVLRAEFNAANVSQPFEVVYHPPPAITDRLGNRDNGREHRILVRYQVQWTDRGNVTVERIRAHDLRGSRLFRGDHDADIERDLRDYYGDAVDPPWRFYLYDEPQWQEVHESMAHVDEIIERVTAPVGGTGRKGVSAFNQRDHRPHLDDYMATVQPEEFLVDYYPFVSGTSRTDIRDSLTNLKRWWGVARTMARTAEIPLWTCLQAHSWPPGGQRDVTPEEIRVQANLALAHGATGIYYFMVSSYVNTTSGTPLLHHSGLLDGNYASTDKWREVTALNARLEALAPTYLALTSNHVFADDALADFVHALSATTGGTDDYFLGTFTHTDDSRYLMVVNEDLTTTPNRTVTVTLNATRLPGSGPYRLLDVYRNTPIAAGGRNPNRPQFSVTLGPGDGTLYRVEKVPVPPPPPNLTATPGHRKLTLSWETPANNGSALRRFQYRRSVDGGRTWAPDWSRDTIIPRSGPATTSHVFGGLTNGTAYTFEIRARSGAGDGEAAQVTSTPLGPPGNLRAAAGDEQVTLSWEVSPANATIAEWQYRSKRASVTEWGDWQTEEEATARQVTVESLDHGHEYQFEVRAINSAEDEGPSASAAAVLHEVTFNSTGYVLIEGGEPLAGQPGRDRVEVMVLLTPAPPSAPGVAIPLTVGAGTAAEDDYAEEDDYEVGPPAFNSSRVLTFGRNQTSKSFKLKVNRDSDTVDEKVELGFGDLPAGVRTGLRPSATVTLYDTPNAPLNVRAEPGHETVTLRWDDPNNPGIAGWQYRKRRQETEWEDWAAAGTGATTTESPVPHLTNGLKYLLQVRAYNGRGYGAASATVEAVPSGLRATAYNGAVELDWVDPKIADLSRWRSRQRHGSPPGSNENTTYVAEILHEFYRRFPIGGSTELRRRGRIGAEHLDRPGGGRAGRVS